jgi:pimeloyl-ACP methyl ester carboxylesterase
VDVTRHVGELNDDGTLKYADELISAGLLSPTATLMMAAYDIDANPQNTTNRLPEVDRVFFNGEDLGVLKGTNNAWTINTFEVDIRKVRFPARGPTGETPTPAGNQVWISIDTLNPGLDAWCTAIGWGAVSIKAMSPTILIHGNNSDSGFWDRHGFSAALAAAHLPFDGCGDASRCQNPINLQTSLVASNGARLSTLIPDVVRTFGADSYHIVAHSKGGLDSREYLANYSADDLTLLSHNTLSTPHNGSVLADISDAGGVSLNVFRQTRFVGFPTFTSSLVFLGNLTGPDAGVRNLTTSFAAGFNPGNVSSLPAADYNQVAADADRNGSASIDVEAEIAALRPDNGFLRNLPTFIATRAVDPLYQILRNTAGITTSTSYRVRLIGGIPVPVQVLTITSVPTAPLGNDVLVTLPSGLGVGSIASRSTGTRQFTGGAGRNHSDVADGGVAAAAILWILRAERTRGDLQ